MIYYKDNLASMIWEEGFERFDFKDWILKEDKSEDNLKKWIRFASGDYPDPDCVLKMDLTEDANILLQLRWGEADALRKKCYLDCIFSFRTFFRAFLWLYAPEYMPYLGQIYDWYDEVFSDSKKQEFCKKNKISLAELKSLFVQLDLFARNTHTIGNYMPCPDEKYNFEKGNYTKYKDRLELFYEDKENETRRKWLDQYKELLELDSILGSRELLEFEFKGKKMSKEDIVPYTKYLEAVNSLIEKRGKTIIRSLTKVKEKRSNQ
ncbi:hypothetical protein lbkm_0866 [Lachnospiraceae bacterium KM106-2]|nr:hypothetical protein lbkm_0866 [Lachnospiraceae bacterium KM106-2]